MRSAIERLGPRQAVLAREDRIEACDAGRDCDERDAGQCRVRVPVLEQPVEGYRDEDKDGWLDEVGRIGHEFPAADMRRLGHGYPELAAHLKGRLSLEEARASTVRQVRQYARRQLTWFRADPRVTWIPPDPEVAIARLGAGIMTAEAS